MFGWCVLLVATALAGAPLDDSARAMAGLPVADGSPLAPVTSRPRWAEERATVDKVWNDYVADDLDPIRAWATNQTATLPGRTVFYPFSGPDVLNAVAFYPQANEYLMLGLERIGKLPDYGPGEEARLVKDMQLTRKAMRVVLQVGYFITMNMSAEVGTSDATGVAGMLSWFLVRTDHELRSARHVTFDAKGRLIEADAQKGIVPTGVEIVFRKRGETQDRVVRYFRGDIQDSHFTTYRKALWDYVVSKGEVLTYLKAASYLMFTRSFDDIRALILARSTAIVSDDSGMPWHFVSRGGWETRLYGQYHKPIADFAGRCQPELQTALASGSRGTLPFDYGYTWYTPHMVVSVRAPGNPIGTPVFDRSSTTGLGVSCYGGRTVVR